MPPKPRAKGAKQGIDVRGGTRARAKAGEAARQQNREAAVANARRDRSEDSSRDANLDDPDNPFAFTRATHPEFVPLRLLPTFAEMAHSDDPAVMFHGVLMVRKLLSVEENPPIQAVVDSGVVPRLVAVLRAGPGSDDEAHEHAAWAVGTVAGDSLVHRDEVLALGAVPALVAICDSPATSIGCCRSATRAIAQLCIYRVPLPAHEATAVALPVLAKLLHHVDTEVVTQACTALRDLSRGSKARTQSVLDAGVLPAVIAMLPHSSWVSLQAVALEMIGNIVTGSESQTQAVIDNGALTAFPVLLNHPRRAIKKEACWCLSNITAGTPRQIQAVIDTGLFLHVKDLLGAAEYKVKKEAVWCIVNTTFGGTKEQLRYLCANIGILDPLCRILADLGDKIVVAALETIDIFLQLGQDDMRDRGLVNPCVVQLRECGGFEKIEALQARPRSEIRTAALAILQTYCYLQHEDDGTVGAV